MLNNKRYDLNDLVIFAAVVEAGSFTAAAKRLSMPKSRVSMRVSELEYRLDVRLLERTTRSLALTEVGRLFFNSCKRVVDEANAGQQIIENLTNSPKGVLRVSAPFAFARSVFAPLVAKFGEHYPEITLSLEVNSTEVDLMRSNIDVALRVRRVIDRETKCEAILEFAQRLVATPSYLAINGTPKKPDDLKNHKVLAGADVQGYATLWKETAGAVESVKVMPQVVVGEPEVRAVMIKNDVGIGWLPAFLCDTELANGSLVECLADYPIPNAVMYVATPSLRAYDIKVRALIEFIKQELGAHT